MAGRSVAALVGKIALAMVSVLVLGATGLAWGTFRELQGLGTSQAISGESSPPGSTQNILVLGLTTRKGMNGEDLPKEVLDNLHAGDSSVGGYNTNTMIVLHVPGDGSKAQAVSVPRDDYVTFVDGPLLGSTKGKLKEAYGKAKEQEQERIYAQGERDPATLEQKAREAGRVSVRKNVEALLNIHIDHLAEISLAGFYDLATQLDGIDVCLKHATSDTNAGANFKQGRQHLNGAQALAFVRQRDNLPNNDLDRTHRQQAFLASITTKLKEQGVFGNLGKLQGMIDVATKDVVIDKGWDLLSFAQQAQNLTGGNIEFHTLPIKGYAKDPNDPSSDINLIDIPYVQALVQTLFNPAPAAAPTAPTTTTPAPPPIKGGGSTVDVRNGIGEDGLAAKLANALSGYGFTKGEATSVAPQASSQIFYGTGAKEDALKLAQFFGGIKATASTSAAPGHVALWIGKGFTTPTALAGATAAAPTTTVPVPTEGPQGGAVDGGGIPCVD
ncbi:LCP family protein [Kutzneria albida]|uniref:Transcription regulator, LytR family n=1 Tax=Kutzneria albida DSM 43870 TaxID=1449976 RepID=W5W4T2_9PSEU|nr:LCP family protein [Kutzneria albida]AHH96238.1 transcription regulator, LytR family [Kutzneria albida DSM 43870]